MRLLDRILSFGFELYEGAQINKGDVSEDLRNSQLVVIDNVADYFFSQRLEDFFTASDFPCVMLPFELCFLEFRFPAQGREITGCEEVGVLLMMQGPDARRGQFPEILDQPGVKYHLAGYHFVRQARSDRVVLMAEFLLPVAGDGQIVSPGNGRIYGVTNILTPGVSEDAEQRNIRFVHQFAGFPVFLALSFMHCRNVRMKEEVPPPKLSKSHQRKRGRPLLRYRVLEIDHMKSVLEREGQASTGGLKKALHICRGHFASYGIDGKGLLFGKHSGRYWIPMHTRGSAEEGVVVKDYEVK